MADAQLAAGDTLGAARTLTRLAADPAASPAFADGARLRLGAAFDAGAWDRSVAEAAALLRERMARAAVDRALPGGVAGVDAEGRPVRLAERLVAAPATVVFFWRSTCPYSREAMPHVARMIADGIPVVAVTDQAPTPELVAYAREQGIGDAAVFDVRRSAHAAFGSASTPEYFVAGAAGRLRFAFSAAGELPRRVAYVAAGR